MYQMAMNVDAADAAKRILFGEVRLVKNRHGMYMAVDVTRRSVLASSTSPERCAGLKMASANGATPGATNERGRCVASEEKND